MMLPICMQIQPNENGLSVLQCVLAYYKKFVRIDELRKTCVESRNGLTAEQILKSGEIYGLKGKIVETKAEELIGIKSPVIICWKKRFFAVVKKINKKYVTLMDPAKGMVTITFEKFKHVYTNKAIYFEPSEKFVKDGKKENDFSMLKNRVSQYKKELFLFLFIDAAIALLSYFYLKYRTTFIDDTMGVEFDSNKFYPLLIILCSLFVAKCVFSVVKILLNYSTARRMSAYSASDLYLRLLKMPASFYEQHSLGELIERLEHNSNLDKTLIQSLIPKFLDILMSLIYIYLMFTYSITLSAVCLGLEIINIVIMFFVEKRTAVLSRSQVSSSGAVNSSVFNCFNNIDTIKSIGSERYYFNLWNKARADFQTEQAKTNNFTLKIDFLNGLHNTIISAFFLFVGALLVIKSRQSNNMTELTLGMLSTFRSVFGTVKNAFSSALSTTNTVRKARTHIERAEDIKRRETQPEYPLAKDELPDKLKCSLEIKNLNFRYHSGDPDVLKNINLSVKPGEMIALVGSSGCGKSTLVKIISGIYKQESGEVLYDGKPREEISDIVFHSSISSVDQETCIFNTTISNNLKMWDDTIENYEMIMAANDAHIHNRITEENKGYFTIMQPDGSNFSGGEIQRLELARALSQEPTLLLLDEFTSALDALTEEKIFNSVRMKGTTCIIIAHRLSTIVNCDRIYVMDHGEIIEQGTHDELYALKGYYHQLVSKS